MMAADSLRSGVLLCMSFGLSLSCCRACRACAFTPRCAQPPEPPSNVQVSCFERARPMAVAAFAGRWVASITSPPGRRGLGRKREAKTEGKTKGGGTCSPTTPVCTWGRSGTARLLRRAVYGVQCPPMLACPRASHARTRPGLPREQP
ncbi:hypothetical protein I6A80_003626 [Pseudomonas aeruginosa]|nr:hypothetical protein I6A80_003626 [Pseudomonas aeruginosa]